MTYFAAHRVMKRHRIWPYMVVPGILSLIYIAGLIIIGNLYFPVITDYLYQHWTPGFLKIRIILMIYNFFLWVLLFLSGYVTYQPVVLIIFSPILSYVSEITESRVYETAGPIFSLRTLLQDLWRSVVINLRNLSRMVVLIILAWLFVLLPLFGAVISACLIFLIQAYYNGFALMDYTLERKRFSVRDSVRFARSNRPRVIGVGIGFMAMMLIPVLGWFAAPTYGAVAATLGALEQIEGPLPESSAPRQTNASN